MIASTDDNCLHRHDAVRTCLDLPLDLFPGLYDHILNSKEFKQWCAPGSSWQFRCIGGPGSGKTTLSSLVLEHLRCRLGGVDVGIASIYIQHDVGFRDKSFLYAFLENLYNQLPASSEGEGLSDTAYLSYKQLVQRPAGCSELDSLKLLRKSVYSRILDLDRTFLVVDGVDLCHPTVQDELEAELLRLQKHGLSIFVASRLPDHESIVEWACDAPEHEGLSRGAGSIFWSCKWCWTTDNMHVICHLCKQRGALCPNCDSLGFLFEPGEKLEMHMSILEGSLRRYIAWDIEREHGDVGLGSLNDRKPPLSALGRSMAKSPKATVQILESILYRAEENIAIARLDLDTLSHAQTVDEAQSVLMGDRLPANIIDLFEHIMNSIYDASKAESHIATTAILAAAHDTSGVWLDDLEAFVHESRGDAEPVKHSAVTIESVLQAARGVLKLGVGEESNIIFPYHDMVRLYVNENYDDRIFWEKSSMKFGRNLRSMTIASGASRRKDKEFGSRFKMRRQQTQF